jgi:quinol-cytochrome oxidoreductase complex cytochrome b subunit
MNRLLQTLIWFLLVPYFAVASLNVRPWVGESRANANRTNAQLAIAIIFASAVLGVLGLTGFSGDLDGISPFLIGLACIVPPMIVVSLLLDAERERHYREVYRTMPARQRAAFGLATLAFVVVMLWLFLTTS